MKKLFAFIMSKDSAEKNAPNKKSSIKEAKTSSSSEPTINRPRELFADDYHDIGYC